MGDSMKYKGLFFDIGWTLMKPSRSWFFSDLFYQLVPTEDLSSDELDAAAQNAMHILDNNHKMGTCMQEEQQFCLFYQELLNQFPELRLSKNTAELLAHDKVYNFRNYIFFSDVLPVLTRLKMNYKLGIISDTWPSAELFLKEAGIYDLFDSITFSCCLGVFKPDPAMYRHALSGIGLSPEETIFVDDCPECLCGAANAGITPIQMLKKPGLSPAPGIKSVDSMTALELLL